MKKNHNEEKVNMKLWNVEPIKLKPHHQPFMFSRNMIIKLVKVKKDQGALRTLDAGNI